MKFLLQGFENRKFSMFINMYVVFQTVILIDMNFVWAQ